MNECICKGNWRPIIEESMGLINNQFKYDVNDEIYTLFGIVHGGNDYYYGMCDTQGKAVLVSCVGSLETSGFTLL